MTIFDLFDHKKKDIKYVFIDVVEYTRRTIEDQHKIVKSLHDLVKKVSDSGVESEGGIGYWSTQKTYLPTGDGLCIAIEGDEPEDIHMRLAVALLRELHNRNKKEKPPFEIRVGVNENRDVVYTDINHNTNFAGRGINHAQRIMDLAGAKQLLVGPVVFEKLGQTDKYSQKFRRYSAAIKGTSTVNIYQYVDESLPFLDSTTPIALRGR